MTAIRRADLVPLDRDEARRGVVSQVLSPARIRHQDQSFKSRIGFTCATLLMAGVALVLWERSVPASRRAVEIAAAPPGRSGPRATAAPSATVSNVTQGRATSPAAIIVPIAPSATAAATVGAVLPAATAPVPPTQPAAPPTSEALPPRATPPPQDTRAVQPTTAPRQATPVPTTQFTNMHIVEKGDTLFSLARRYGTTVDAIVTHNGLGTSGTPLRIGLQLTVP